MLFSRCYLCALCSIILAIIVSFTSALEEEAGSLDEFGFPARQAIVIPDTLIQQRDETRRSTNLRALYGWEHQSAKKKPTVGEKKKKKNVKPLVHNARKDKPYDHEFGRQSSRASQSRNHHVVKSGKSSGGKSGKSSKGGKVSSHGKSGKSKGAKEVSYDGWHEFMSMMDYF